MNVVTNTQILRELSQNTKILGERAQYAAKKIHPVVMIQGDIQIVKVNNKSYYVVIIMIC